MLVKATATVLAIVFLALLEPTLVAGLFGGAAMVKVLLVSGLLRMTHRSSRQIWLWITVSAAAGELFSSSPFGVASVSLVAALLATRLVFYTIFTHRTFIARGLCLGIGVFLNALSIFILISFIELIKTQTLFFGAIGSSLIWHIQSAALTLILTIIAAGIFQLFEGWRSAKTGDLSIAAYGGSHTS